MSSLSSHRSDRDPAQLPPELRTELDALSEAERAELEAVWRLTAQAAPQDELDTQHLSHEMWTALETASQPSSLRRIKWIQSRTWYSAGLAATVLILIGLGFLLWQLPERATAPAGKQAHVTLPDGSVVVLNSASTLTYPRHFDETVREVHLDGEAFFEVEPETRPFHVATFNADVTVLGTRFNVRSRTHETVLGTTVTLESGSVRVTSAAEAGESVVLEPGQTVRVGSAQATLVRLGDQATRASLAWRNGYFDFSEPLHLAIAELERRFDIEIELAPELANDSLAILFNTPETAETLLQDIAKYKGYHLTSTPDGYRLSRSTP